MKYLDERIIANIETQRSDTSLVTSTGMYQYDVQYMKDDGTYETLFVGNIFLEKGILSTTIDITDIARNYCANKTEIVEFLVNIFFGTRLVQDDTVTVIPIYRYPNYSITDVLVSDTYNTVLLSGLAKTDQTNTWIYQNSLIPTYPKVSTDKLNLNYNFLMQKDPAGWVLDYGPTQDLSSLAYGNKIDELTYPIKSTTKTESCLNWWDSYYCWQYMDNSDVYISSVKSIEFKFTSYIKPDEYYFEFSDGNTDGDSITDFPASYGNELETDAADGDYLANFYIENYNYGEICGLEVDTLKDIHITTGYDLNITEELKIPTLHFPITGWEWKNDSYYLTLSSTPSSYQFIFLDEDDTEVLKQTATEATAANPFTIEWDNTGVVVYDATLYIGNTAYSIPTQMINQNDPDDESFRNVVFSLSVTNNVARLTPMYSEYTISLTVSGKDAYIKHTYELSDSIVLHNVSKDKYSTVSGTQTLIPKVINGDVDISQTDYVYSFASKSDVKNIGDNKQWKFVKCYLLVDGVAVAQQSTKYDALTTTSQSILFPAYTSIHNYSVLCYFVTEDGYDTFKVTADCLKDLYTNGSRNKVVLNIRNNKLEVSIYKDEYYWATKTTDASAKIGNLVEPCSSKYFVIWKDRYTTQQIQPFNKVDTYSEDITGNEITNYWGKRSLYAVDVQPKWKLQTGWISDDAYRCYESLFVTPTVQIYDTESDHLYDVIIKDRNYTEKTFQNQGKLFNLELTFEAAEEQNIIY